MAAAIGVPVAFFTAKRRFFGRRFLLSFSAIPLCVPSLIVALAYVSFFGINGTANNIIKLITGMKESPIKFLYSTVGIIVAQGFYNFPFVLGIINDAWQELPVEEENAARLLGAGEMRVLFTITLKKLQGAIVAACIPVFLFCFFSFMIVLLFSPVGKSSLEVEIYHSVRTTLDLKSGAKLAVLETFLAMLIVGIYSVVGRKSQIHTSGINFAIKDRPAIGNSDFATKTNKAVEIILFILLILIIIIFFVLPAFSILVSALTVTRRNQSYYSLELFKGLFTGSTFKTALWNSVWIGCVTGFLCVTVGFVYSAFVKINRHSGNVLLQILPILPMAISSVVISWVATLIFHRGNELLLIGIQVFLYWPVAYRQIQNGINQISKETDSAALMLSKNKLDSIWRVYLPSCKKVLISAFSYCFAMSIGDATLPLVLSIPRFTNLALYTYRLASSYRFNQACACGLILVALCSIVFFLGKSKKEK